MKFRLGGVFGLWALFTGIGFADSISGVTFGNSGTAYWNNPSKDVSSSSVCGNIGCVLLGIYGQTASVNTSLLSWGTNAGAIPGSINFLGDTYGFLLTAIQNSTANSLTFGWYDASNPSNKTVIYTLSGNAACLTQAAGCSAAPGTSPTLLTFSTNYGFYVTVTYADTNKTVDTYYTNSALNTANGVANGYQNVQHFVVFQQSGYYYLGFEDSLFYNGFDPVENRGDFQDLIVRLAPVPEPSSFVLLALGVGGLGAFRKFRKRA